MEARYVHTPAIAPESRAQESEPAIAEASEPPQQNFSERLEHQIREHPGLAVAGGLILGFLIGLMARR